MKSGVSLRACLTHLAGTIVSTLTKRSKGHHHFFPNDDINGCSVCRSTRVQNERFVGGVADVFARVVVSCRTSQSSIGHIGRDQKTWSSTPSSQLGLQCRKHLVSRLLQRWTRQVRSTMITSQGIEYCSPTKCGASDSALPSIKSLS